MKVLLVSSMNGLGGTERSTQQIAKLLKDNGHDVFLIGTEGPLIEDIRAIGVNVYICQTHSKKPLELALFVKLCRKVIKKNNIQVIHAQMAFPVPLIYLARLTSLSKVKIVWHARGLRAHSYKYVSRLFSWLGVYSISNSLKEMNKLIRYGYNSKYLTYMYNICQLDGALNTVQESFRLKYNIPKETFVIGSMSRLSRERGVHHALEYFHMLLSRGNIKNVILLIAGEGPEKDNLTLQAESLGIKEYVHFIGRVTNVIDFYGSINLFWNPICTIKDEGAGTGNTLIESAFMRVPIVSHDAIAVTELILNEKTGFVTNVGNGSKFVEFTERLYSNPKLYHEISQRCYELSVSQSSKSTFYNKLISFYE